MRAVVCGDMGWSRTDTPVVVVSNFVLARFRCSPP
jgi:hypothetical protein